ncbi:MAG: hypothetical protein ACI9TH_000748 [Kiritimatiellia bacterium]|jgi:hypothetical protein
MQNFKEMQPSSKAFCPENGAIEELNGEQLMDAWGGLSPGARYQLLRQAGTKLRAYHLSGASLLDINLRQSTFDHASGDVRLWPPPSSHPHLALSHFQQLHLLARWYAEWKPGLNTREAIQFISGFMCERTVEKDAIRSALFRIRHYALNEARRLVRRIYSGHLKDGTQAKGCCGIWSNDPSVTPELIRAALVEAEQSEDRQVLKQSAFIHVFRVPLLGQDAVVKRYDVRKARDRAKKWARASRGRRAYAAACTLLELKIDTPPPLGYLEGIDDDGHSVSYFINRWLPEARTARQFIKPWLHQRPVETRQVVSQQLFDMLNQLYQLGIYHGDTKASNLLVTRENDDTLRSFYWIDLESMQFGIKPMRYHMLRNLVQLNGSIGRKILPEERIAFLHRFSPVYPWARDPQLPALIESKTRTRLLRELNRICGY